jgi:hypothetical protein
LPEWLVERGIGETRSARIADGEIVEARIQLDGIARAGTRLAARLKTSRPQAIADAQGEDYLLPKGAPGIAEGGTLTIEVTRERIPGSEPWKRALARVTDEAPSNQPLNQGAGEIVPITGDALGGAGWSDLIDEARSGLVRFAGGELRISATPAMTLIDVDGHIPVDELAVVGAAAAALAILRLDIGGSIGIDLPTIQGKEKRQQAAVPIDSILPQPFERTAVNGFGFVQIVRPRVRASLIELAADRAGFEARALLRRVALDPPGSKRIVAHPNVIQLLNRRTDWLETLARQIGGAVALRSDPSLTIFGGYAEPD